MCFYVAFSFVGYSDSRKKDVDLPYSSSTIIATSMYYFVVSDEGITLFNRFLAFCLCVFFIVPACCGFEVLQINTITHRDGLSQNTVRCMMQDSKGFLWFGTINGANRYSGKEFLTIKPGPEVASSVTDNRVRHMLEDRNGFVWIHTFSNTIFCYDPRLESFVDYPIETGSNVFSRIIETADGDIWLSGKQGCNRLSYINGELQSQPFGDPRLHHLPISVMFEDSEHRVWLGTDKELFMVKDHSVTTIEKEENYKSAHEINGRLFFISDTGITLFDSHTLKLLSKTAFPGEKSVTVISSCLIDEGVILISCKDGIYAFDTQNRIMTPADAFFQGERLCNARFYIDNKANVWVCNMSGVLWRHHAGNRFEALKLIPPGILSLINSERYEIYHDSRGIIWITTFGNGLFAIDTQDGTMHHYTLNKDLPSNYLLCVMEDKSGEMWIGTEFVGAIKISLANYPVRILNVSDEDGDRANAVRLIYKDRDQRYWLGTRSGSLYVCNSAFEQLHSYRVDRGLPFCMAEDTLGYKWLGTKGEGLFLFPPKDFSAPQVFHLQSKDGQSSSSNNIFTILRDSNNQMWISTFGGGLHLAKREGGQLSFTQINMKNEQQDMMRAMIEDRTGLIWVGTNDGAIVFRPEELIQNNEKYLNFRSDSKNPQTLSNNEVKVIFEDSKGNIWLGTTGGGLNLLVREQPLQRSWFKHYTSKNGLSNEIIQAIQEDNDGYIWVSTENDISRFDPKAERFENIVLSDSKHPPVFSELCSWKRAGGELMFGSYNGIYRFDPADIVYNTHTPPVTITDLRINGNNVKPGEAYSPLTESITTTSRIVLRHNQNSFNLEFAVLDFHAPEYNQYTYYLEAYEKNWNHVSRGNVATYRNVPAGNYTFRVRGSNSFGVWSSEETALEIVIRPPWWRSGWAILLYVILASIIVFFVSRMLIKIHRLNTAVEVEKQLTEYKLRFFTNISHEFRTPLTIIRGAIDNLSGCNDLPWHVGKQVSALSKSSSRLLRLIDQLLEFRRLQNNKMELRLERTNAVSFFYDIYLTFNDMAERKHIEYRFESDEKRQEMLIDKNKMDKVAYNLLSNAFKHVPDGGKITMKCQFSVNEDRFILSVADNGEGISQEQRGNLFTRFYQVNYTSNGTGVGLHLTAELVKVHRGNITYVESEWGGACFRVALPLSDAHYSKEDIINGEEVVYTPETVVTDSFRDIKTFDLPIGKPYKEHEILVIEDDDDVREFIVDQLGLYFTVSFAVDGAEGLKKIADSQPHVIVCDVMMPGIDGFELTKRVKNGVDTSHIPVILLTAHSSEQHQLEGVKMGADDYITKPFSVEYLFTRILKLIEQRNKLQQMFMTEPGLKQLNANFTDRDRVFLNKLHDVVEKNMANADFTIDEFAQALLMARTTFFKKVKGLTGYPPNEYLRIIRLKKAAELLLTTNLNVSEISYRVGINDQFYFSKSFKHQFGVSPTHYRKG